jgi:hypothetical protein
MNWRDKPLVSYQLIVQLIAATTTETGLKVCCEIDGHLYPKEVEVSDDEIQLINIMRNKFHGEWNYTSHPINNHRDAPISPQA